jgi:hypothetical protein
MDLVPLAICFCFVAHEIGICVAIASIQLFISDCETSKDICPIETDHVLLMMAVVCMFGAFVTVYNYCWTLFLEKEQEKLGDGDLSYEAYANLIRKSIFLYWTYDFRQY